MGCSASRKLLPQDIPDDYKPDYKGKEGPFFVMTPDAEARIYTAPKGPGSLESCPATTVVDLLELCAKKHGEKIALRVERVEKDGRMVTPPPVVDGKKKSAPALPDDQWKTWTYNQYVADANTGAKSLMAMGIEQFGAVGIFGFNSPEWFLAQVCAMSCGAKSAGIYPSDRVDNIVYKLKHSKSAVCFMEDDGKVARLQVQKDEDGKDYNPVDDLPDLKYVVTWAATPNCPKELKGDKSTVQVIDWKTFMEMGAKVSDDDLKTRQEKIKPGHCGALIYTSGTTGKPKAVMISHDNIIFEATNVMKCVRSAGVGAGGQERIVSYLPLSHIAGMMVDIICPLFLTARSDGYSTVSFARPYDLKFGTIKDRLVSAKPTIFLGVPRVWEKIADKLKAIGATNTGMKAKLSAFAKAKLLAKTSGMQANQEEQNPSFMFVANFVAKKVKDALGLTELKYGFTGAAPIQKHTLEYFGSLGIMINELYGMSECTGATTISTDETHIWGSCGWTLPGTEVKILREGKDGKFEDVPRAKDCFNATEEEQGEICFRGRHIMMGYLGNPDFKGDGGMEWAKKKNESAIDAEGWLHSGDKGCMDKNGFVKITGRYKELIIGAGGENVAPVPIESNIKKICPAISNIMMVGDKRKFNIALVSLKAVGATGEEPGTDELDKPAKIVEGVETISQAIESKEVAAAIWKAIDETNKNPKVCPKAASQIRRFTIIPVDFSVSGGELTSTLKLKRSVVQKQYLAAIDKVYADDVPKTQTYVQCFGGNAKVAESPE